ncbi:sulfatase [Flavobacteriaceae bacterium]|jgi:iduronate 2-sulfatase|nr:sulfatase [Flavobacteriaceae bacterium]|tara:strand:+ start:400 stop:1953 length:1554 start_codon:yes stop_codon:yes gene_type:complete
MKYIKITLGLLFFVLVLGCKKSNTIDKNQKLNVLFIIADDLNCDLGSYGHPQVISPNIDKLAKNGTLFGNVHNQYPLCGPSRASFMTGMYTDQTKMTNNNVLLRTTVPDVITMGQRFRQQGYRSVRIGKIYHFDNPSSIGTSSADDIYTWDQTINPYGRDKIEEYKINTLTTRQYGGTLSWLAADGTDEEQTDGIGATEAIEQLESFSKTGQNFFLAVGMYRPHTPFVAPKKYFDMYDRNSIEIPYNGSNDEYLKTIPKTAANSIRLKKNQIKLNLKSNKKLAQEIKEAYFATTTFVDAQIGRILKKLKQTGLDKNTIVVFTSDHGYHLGEHGHWQKQTLFDNSTRVPLIFSGPGIESNIRIENSPVELIDIYPTLMDLTGIELPDHVVGKSLKPVFENNNFKTRNSALTRWRNGYSIKTENFRLTKWGENGELGYELYDHKNDKEELKNLVSNPNYSLLLDSMKIEIDIRIANAKLKPKGVGRQFEQESYRKAPNLTHGDIYNKNGKRIYFKPADK